jgi:hypothetical protein
MAKHQIRYWMIGRPEAQADAAYDAGLTDGEWVFKGGMMFVEFEREAATKEEAAAAVAADLRRHGVPFDERTLDSTDPTDELSEHSGYYDDEELDEIIEELAASIADGEASEDDVRVHALLVAHKASGNKPRETPYP